MPRNSPADPADPSDLSAPADSVSINRAKIKCENSRKDVIYSSVDHVPCAEVDRCGKGGLIKLFEIDWLNVHGCENASMYAWTPTGVSNRSVQRPVEARGIRPVRASQGSTHGRIDCSFFRRSRNSAIAALLQVLRNNRALLRISLNVSR